MPNLFNEVTNLLNRVPNLLHTHLPRVGGAVQVHPAPVAEGEDAGFPHQGVSQHGLFGAWEELLSIY